MCIQHRRHANPDSRIQLSSPVVDANQITYSTSRSSRSAQAGRGTLVARQGAAIVNTEFVDQRYHRPMSEKPASGPPTRGASRFTAAPGPAGFPPAAGSPLSPLTPRRASRWPTLAVLLVALIGVAAGVAAWFRPMPQPTAAAASPEPTYTEQQIGDAKRNVCDAYGLVRTAVSVTTNKQAPGGDDFATKTAIAANGRLALHGGGGYLLERLSADPATPSNLAVAIRSLAATLRKLAIVDLGEQPDSAQPPLRDSVPRVIANIDGLCK
jgi:hypothetical protein